MKVFQAIPWWVKQRPLPLCCVHLICKEKLEKDLAWVHRMTIKQHNGIPGAREVMGTLKALGQAGKYYGDELCTIPLFPERRPLCKIHLSNPPSSEVPRGSENRRRGCKKRIGGRQKSYLPCIGIAIPHF